MTNCIKPALIEIACAKTVAGVTRQLKVHTLYGTDAAGLTIVAGTVLTDALDVPVTLAAGETISPGACCCLVIPNVQKAPLAVALVNGQVTLNNLGNGVLVADALTKVAYDPITKVLSYTDENMIVNTFGLVQSENEIIEGFGAPTVAPLDPSEGKAYFDKTAGNLTHFWNPATNTWVPIVQPFPTLKLCNNANAAPADKFLTDVAATVSAATLGASAHLWSHPDAGGCPTKLVAPTTCTTVLPSIVGGGALGVIDAAGNIGLGRATVIDRPIVRTVAGSTTLNPAVEQGIYISAAGIVTLATPVLTDFCQNTMVFVKRTTNDPLIVTRVTAAAGIDGAPGNTIQLGTSSKFGTLTGEGAWFQFDGTTWRIVASY